jgi:hypothetical protein
LVREGKVKVMKGKVKVREGEEEGTKSVSG